jgi:hypothetical protein
MSNVLYERRGELQMEQSESNMRAAENMLMSVERIDVSQLIVLKRFGGTDQNDERRFELVTRRNGPASVQYFFKHFPSQLESDLRRGCLKHQECLLTRFWSERSSHLSVRMIGIAVDAVQSETVPVGMILEHLEFGSVDVFIENLLVQHPRSSFPVPIRNLIATRIALMLLEPYFDFV